MLPFPRSNFRQHWDRQGWALQDGQPVILYLTANLLYSISSSNKGSSATFSAQATTSTRASISTPAEVGWVCKPSRTSFSKSDTPRNWDCSDDDDDDWVMSMSAKKDQFLQIWDSSQLELQKSAFNLEVDLALILGFNYCIFLVCLSRLTVSTTIYKLRICP